MGKIDTVVGVERFAVNYGPNGIECDQCDRRELFERHEYPQILNDLRERHWLIVEDVHLCPNCHLEVQAEDAQQNC